MELVLVGCFKEILIPPEPTGVTLLLVVGIIILLHRLIKTE
jgi:branched-subunit amino acid transport protein AzlD